MVVIFFNTISTSLRKRVLYKDTAKYSNFKAEICAFFNNYLLFIDIKQSISKKIKADLLTTESPFNFILIVHDVYVHVCF